MAALAQASSGAAAATAATKMPSKPRLLRQGSSVDRAGLSLEQSVRTYLESLEEEKSEAAVRISKPKLEIGLQRVHVTLEIEASLLAGNRNTRDSGGAVIEEKVSPTTAGTELKGRLNLVSARWLDGRVSHIQVDLNLGHQDRTTASPTHPLARPPRTAHVHRLSRGSDCPTK